MKTKVIGMRLTDAEIQELEKRAAGKKLPAYIKTILFPVNKPSPILEEPAPVPSSPPPKIPEKIPDTPVVKKVMPNPQDVLKELMNPKDGKAVLAVANRERMDNMKKRRVF